MNKSEITFEDLQIRISNFIEKANIAAQNVTFNFNVEDSVDTSISFTSIKGMNVHRIIQEALNNALKYSEASQIEVHIHQKNSNMTISISDDGKGFEKDNTNSGNGLLNIEKRGSEIDAKLSIDSESNIGTTIKLNL
ncbi:sensor histidine kinase [Winogradskyella sp.]|uniref:sensor histidine kinase n=1 Tax=Winogradskyella sp. TaxID=1883156 RepID=UPI003F6A6ABD